MHVLAVILFIIGGLVALGMAIFGLLARDFLAGVGGFALGVVIIAAGGALRNQVIDTRYLGKVATAIKADEARYYYAHDRFTDKVDTDLAIGDDVLRSAFDDGVNLDRVSLSTNGKRLIVRLSYYSEHKKIVLDHS